MNHFLLFQAHMIYTHIFVKIFFSIFIRDLKKSQSYLIIENLKSDFCFNLSFSIYYKNKKYIA